MMQRQEMLSMCAGKEMFESRSLAERVAKRYRKHKKGQLVAYQCQRCRLFHIGNASPKARRK